MVVTEANAVGTAYLRVGFLDDPDRTTSRELLTEYVEIRLAAADDPTQLKAILERSEAIHGELWSILEKNVRLGEDSDVMALLIESINEVIDVHTVRLTVGLLRLPRLLGIVLYAATILNFVLVGVANSADGKRDPIAIFLFALAFVAVLMVLIDLDRPNEGLLNVPQTAISDLLRTMKSAAP
jgi:hypothetical protein